jgi:hypothetical protein
MRFKVFKNGEVESKFTLSGVYMFGTDGIAIRRAKVKFKKGIIECDKPNQEAAGLALLWPIEGFGKVLLPTTCVPEKEEPYILNVEIARAKLMQIVTKREDWSFFNEEEEPGDISKKAQDLFIRALQNISDASLASKLADKALKQAIVSSEELARKQAGSLFEIRSETHGFGRGCLGCIIDPEQISNPGYVEKLLKLFGFITVPVNWGKIEPEKGFYDFSKTDACIELLSKKKLAISAGPLLRFSKEHLPKWLLESKWGFEKIREMAYQFVSRMVSRYPSVRSWCVTGSLNSVNHFGFDFEQILEMTRAASMAVKAASDRALKIIEVSNPWGEYYATMPNSIPPLVYVDMVVQSGINFDAFGLQIRLGKDEAGMHVRDMLQVSSVLDYFVPIAKPVYITAVEVPSANGSGSHDSEVAGIWHKEWGQSQQSQWLEQFYKIALSKPFVDGVTYSNLCDVNGSTIANSGLLTSELEPKKSYQTLQKLRDTIFNREG